MQLVYRPAPGVAALGGVQQILSLVPELIEIGPRRQIGHDVSLVTPVVRGGPCAVTLRFIPSLVHRISGWYRRAISARGRPCRQAGRGAGHADTMGMINR